MNLVPRVSHLPAPGKMRDAGTAVTALAVCPMLTDNKARSYVRDHIRLFQVVSKITSTPNTSENRNVTEMSKNIQHKSIFEPPGATTSPQRPVFQNTKAF